MWARGGVAECGPVAESPNVGPHSGVAECGPVAESPNVGPHSGVARCRPRAGIEPDSADEAARFLRIRRPREPSLEPEGCNEESGGGACSFRVDDARRMGNMLRMPSEATDAARIEVFGTVFFLVQHLARCVDLALVPLDLTTKQWLLLVVLTKKLAGENPTLSEAARWYGSSRQNVKRIAEQLESRGYVRLEPDPEDARAIRLRVLPKVAVFDTRPERARQAALMEEMFAWATPAELERFRSALRRWIAHLSPGES
jgi:DNA-binding MarR family transcriptional regulator